MTFPSSPEQGGWDNVVTGPETLVIALLLQNAEALVILQRALIKSCRSVPSGSLPDSSSEAHVPVRIWLQLKTKRGVESTPYSEMSLLGA